MKQIFISILALTVAAARLSAQDVGGAQADMVKARAKQQRDINNQQQGIAPLAPTTQPGPGSYPAPGSPSTPQAGINPVQQALIDRLETDLTAVKPGTTPTDLNKTGLQKDIDSLAKGANKPTPALTAKLAADLADALADKAVTAKDLAQLAKDVNIIVNCAPISPPRAQTFIAGAQNILKASGASEASAKAVANDLQAVVIQIQKAKPKLYQ
jgi:hypothetical protein